MEIYRVTEADYDDIVSIRDDVYEGLDYLPCLFKEWLPNHEGYLAKINGKAVAFKFLVYLDDGESYCLRSGRVRKEYEGKGVFRKLTEHINELVKTKPGVKRQVIGFPERGPVDKINSGEYKLILKRDLLTYRQTREQACRTLQNTCHILPSGSVVSVLTKNDIIESFQQKTLLFPENCVVIDWMPCRLLKSNLDLFWSYRYLAVGTKKEDGQYSLISIGNWATSSIGVRYLLDLCGEVDDSLAGHIKIHMKKFVEVKQEVIIFKIFHHPSSNKELIRKTMENLGCHSFKHCDNLMYCVEKEHNSHPT